MITPQNPITMWLRVGYLWLWLVGVTFFACYATLGNESLARFATDALGAEAFAMLSERGALKLYTAAVAANVHEVLPFLALGAALGALCRLIDWSRRFFKRRAAARVNVVTDRFGGRVIMHQAALEHDPNAAMPLLRLSKREPVPAGASPIEREVLALLAAHPEIPADPDGVHGVSLFDHSLNTWERACTQHGAGSLVATLSLCHDLGKLLAYVPDADGDYRRIAIHQPLALQLVRRLPAFAQLDAPARDRFIRLLTALVTGAIPIDTTDEDRAILRACKGADYAATGAERAAQEEEERAATDPSQVASLVRTALPSLLQALNVNRCHDRSVRPEAIYLPEKNRLLLPLASLRKRIPSVLPAEIELGIDLAVPEKRAKQANAFVLAVARAVLDLDTVFEGASADDGLFMMRSGHFYEPNVVVVRAEGFADSLIKQWGMWSYEIELVKQ